jgi:ABC-2 type transport system ATP-binding protein
VAGIDVAGNPVEAKRRLAVVPQRTNLDRSLSARQNLVFHAAYFGMPDAERQARADTLLEEFGLGDRGDDKVDRYSGGQAQRLMIARALMHQPQVLFLDEPTTGLDPQARLFVWDRIRDLRARGVTMVLTTHDMDEAAELADRVGIMDNGRLLALDTPVALTASVPGRSMLEVGVTLDPAAGDGEAERLVQSLSSLPGVERSERVEAAGAGGPGGGGPPWGAGPPPWAGGGAGGPAGAPAEPAGRDGQVRLRLYASVEAATLVVPVAQALVERQATLADLRLGEPTLEDVFIGLTGRGLR